MRKDTRKKFNEYTAQVATINDAESATAQFAVAPSVQQTMETRMQESSAFLQAVNIQPVDEIKGEKLGLGIGEPVASTTNTDDKDRQTADPTGIDATGYECTQTNSDTHIKYSKLDAWAKFKDFQARVRNSLLQRQALDRIIIGFNGVDRAANSDRVKNPLLQDVNKGWLQKYRENASARVLNKGKAGGAILVGGDNADYSNLDALVFDAVNNLIAPWWQEDAGLVAICGRRLLADKLFPLLNQNVPTEKLAADMIVSQKRIGDHGAVRVPYFPANSIFITRLDNLSIYWQEGSRRRTITDNPRRDRIENFESSNDAYVVEDYSAGCLIENIQIAPVK